MKNFPRNIYQHGIKYLKRAEDETVFPNPSKESTSSLQIVAVNNTATLVKNIMKTVRGHYEKLSANEKAQIAKWA